MPVENYKNLIKELANIIGIPEMHADEEGYCFLKIDEKLMLTILYDENSNLITLYSDIGSYNEDNEKTIFKMLLEANYLWAGTSGATLGVNSKNKTILMFYRESMEYLSFQRFFDIIETFINTAEILNKKISEAGQETNGESFQGKSHPVTGILV